MTTLANVADSRSNNFDFLRFILASLVIYSHSFDLTGQQGEALLWLTNHQLPASGLAVCFFFVISGFLVTQSWDRNSSLLAFGRKRFLRIVPGFVVAVLSCILVFGPLSTPDLGGYFSNSTTWRFASLLCLKGPQEMTAVFLQNPLPGSMNGSLWTIRFEILCYILVAVLGAFTLLRRRSVVTALFAMSLLAFWTGPVWRTASVPEAIGNLSWLLPYFGAGMCAYVWRGHIPLSRNFALLCLAALAATSRHGLQFSFPLCGSYLLFFVAYHPSLRLDRFAARQDLSYGIYLYAFPVQQLLVQWIPSISAWGLTMSAFVGSCGLAALSWFFVEKRFLRSRRTPVKPINTAAELSPA